MKRLLLLFVCIICMQGAFSQITYDNFDDIRIVDYGFVNGQRFEYIGKDMGPLNNSGMVGQYTRNPSALFDVMILNGGIMQDLTPYVNGTKQMTMDVFSPAPGLTVQITLEDNLLALPGNYPIGRHSEYLATTTATNAWETLTFTFSNRPDLAMSNTTVNQLVLLFNPNSSGSETYFIDNIKGPELVSPKCAGSTPDPQMLNDLECNQNMTVHFRHGDMRRLVNPSKTGINTSSHSVRYLRNAGILDDVVVGKFEKNITIASGTQIKMHVYDANAPSIITMAIQDTNGVDLLPSQNDTVTTTNVWTELTFNLGAGAGSNIGQFVILYKPGTNLPGTIYYDNIKVVTPPPSCGAVDSSWTPIKLVDAVRIDWKKVTGATKYIVTGGPAGQNPANWIKLVKNNPPLDAFNLNPGVTFNYRIIAICGMDTATPSPLFSFTTTTCMPPASTSTTNVTSTTAVLNWSQAPEAKKYEIVGRKLPGGGLVTLTVNGGTMTSRTVSGLSPSTTYEWAVKNVCKSDGSIKSGLTSSIQFTTLSAKEEAEQISAQSKVSVFPNPAKDIVHINNLTEGSIVSVYDISGKLLFLTETTNSKLSIPVKEWNNGWYQITIETNESTEFHKLIIAQ